MSDSWRPSRDKSERVARSVQSMTPGTVNGRVSQASPVDRTRRDETGGLDVTEAIFSYAGTPAVGETSPPYFNRVASVDVGTLIACTSSNTSGPTTVALMKNGTTIATITIPAGEKSNEVIVEDVTLAYGNRLTVQCTAVGPGLDGLTVQALLEG